MSFQTGIEQKGWNASHGGIGRADLKSYAMCFFGGEWHGNILYHWMKYFRKKLACFPSSVIFFSDMKITIRNLQKAGFHIHCQYSLHGQKRTVMMRGNISLICADDYTSFGQKSTGEIVYPF